MHMKCSDQNEFHQNAKNKASALGREYWILGIFIKEIYLNSSDQWISTRWLWSLCCKTWYIKIVQFKSDFRFNFSRLWMRIANVDKSLQIDYQCVWPPLNSYFLRYKVMVFVWVTSLITLLAPVCWLHFWQETVFSSSFSGVENMSRHVWRVGRVSRYSL